MKKSLLFLFLLMGGMTLSFSQTATDSITMKKVFGGYQFYQDNNRLSMNKLVNAMRPNEQAFKEIKSAQSTYALATVIGAAGGFMIGYPIGTAIAGGDANWTLAGIGAGLAVVSILITQKFNKQAKQAIDTYNKGLQSSSFWNRHQLNLTMSENGIGLTLKF
ncbi:hypothetical protein [Anaerophaga thermohalophila]|jgi:hypothetical protein|uniref:hypothetical protein n=1 Tax=Anaerophaga thermohalophila TaxID=177400 RepID=UPI00031F2146|nr:hypothetical protein [Anaerophaga thermohalophila]